MISSVRTRTGYGYSQVKRVGNCIRSIFENRFFLDNSFASCIEISEKVDTKFSKPTGNSNGSYHVFIGGWRLVGQDREKAFIRNPQMYERDLNIESTLYAPSSTSLYNVVTPEGITIAEVISDNIVNLLFDVCKLNDSDLDFMLYNIFKDIIVNHNKLDITDLEEIARVNNLNKVSTFLLELSSREVKSAERRFSSIENEIRRVESRLKDLIEERRDVMIQVEGFRRRAEESVDKLNDEINKVTQLDRVKSVTIDTDDREVVITTDSIYVVNSNKRHYIGEFKIYINPVSTRVRFENLNNCRRSYWGPRCHHPHVDQSGSACWGNVSHAIVEYIKQNEYQALASLLIGFLESVNTQDPAGKNITSWDVVNLAGKVIQTGYDYRNPPADTTVYTCYECGDSYSRDNLAMTKGDMHICRHCADKYFTCPVCGDIHDKDDAEHCDRCNALICEDCADDHDICPSCIEAERVMESLEEGQSICPFCNEVVNDDELLTCETCGEQGCSTCIQLDRMYSCPNHR